MTDRHAEWPRGTPPPEPTRPAGPTPTDSRGRPRASPPAGSAPAPRAKFGADETTAAAPPPRATAWLSWSPGARAARVCLRRAWTGPCGRVRKPVRVRVSHRPCTRRFFNHGFQPPDREVFESMSNVKARNRRRRVLRSRSCRSTAVHRERLVSTCIFLSVLGQAGVAFCGGGHFLAPPRYRAHTSPPVLDGAERWLRSGHSAASWVVLNPGERPRRYPRTRRYRRITPGGLLAGVVRGAAGRNKKCTAGAPPRRAPRAAAAVVRRRPAGPLGGCWGGYWSGHGRPRAAHRPRLGLPGVGGAASAPPRRRRSAGPLARCGLLAGVPVPPRTRPVRTPPAAGAAGGEGAASAPPRRRWSAGPLARCGAAGGGTESATHAPPPRAARG